MPGDLGPSIRAPDARGFSDTDEPVGDQAGGTDPPVMR